MLNIPLTDPIAIFLLVLIIILVATLGARFHIPQIIGLIVAGVILGPDGLGILDNDQSFKLFGKVGILYIMFQVGLDVDLKTFKLQKKQGVLFGIYTFVIPLVMGLFGGWLIGMDVKQSLLMSAMMSCHTLLTYPVVGKMGINDNRAINIVITGTIITVTASLLLIAGVTGVVRGGDSWTHWLTLAGGTLLFAAFVFLIVPRLTVWFFGRFGDGITQYIYVLAVVFMSSLIAQAAGLEGILGAFFAGLVLNRYVKPASPLMVRISFVGNALFIPFFLISVGMQINLSGFVEGIETWRMAAMMCVVAIGSKLLAAKITQWTSGLTRDEGNIIFGLTTSKAAAALAAVAIGVQYGIFNNVVLNGTVVMILVAVVVSSFVTERSARGIAKVMHSGQSEDQIRGTGRVMISVSNPQTVRSLVEFANLIKPEGTTESLYALKIATDEAGVGEGYKVLNEASKVAAETDNQLQTIMRSSINVPSCTVNCAREYHINDIVVGVHRKANIVDTFMGRIVKSLIDETAEHNFLIFGARTEVQKLNRMVVMVPQNAENELGFMLWMDRVANLASRGKMSVTFASSGKTLRELERLQSMFKGGECRYIKGNDVIDRLGENDLLVMIMARRTTVSYNAELSKVPQMLSRNQRCSYLIVYPQQRAEGGEKWSIYSATKIS